MDITQIVFVYAIPTSFAIFVVAVMILLAKMSASTRTLLKADLGGKFEIVLKADPDYKLAILPFRFERPGILIRRSKSKASEMYVFGIPTTSLQNDQETSEIATVEKQILTPYTLHGKPIHCVHSATAIVSNPRVLTALTYNGKTTDENKLELDTAIPDSETKSKLTVKGLFPFKFDSITKHFNRNWPDVLLENIGLTEYMRGAKEQRRSYKEYIWPLVIVGIVVIAGMVITGLATGLL